MVVGRSCWIYNTVSLFDPPAFEGWWRSDDRGWVLDMISMLTIDVPFTDNIAKFVELLSTEIAIKYITAGSGHDELGISVSELILTTYDPSFVRS
jgi:hypothetical protein